MIWRCSTASCPTEWPTTEDCSYKDRRDPNRARCSIIKLSQKAGAQCAPYTGSIAAALRFFDHTLQEMVGGAHPTNSVNPSLFGRLIVRH